MKLSAALYGYEGFARTVALRARAGWDSVLGSGGRRRIRTETSNFVLGAEAIPAPVPFGGTGFRR